MSHERLSRKTDQRVTETGRIDVFSREQRAGFDQYGNETEKWATNRQGSDS